MTSFESMREVIDSLLFEYLGDEGNGAFVQIVAFLIMQYKDTIKRESRKRDDEALKALHGLAKHLDEVSNFLSSLNPTDSSGDFIGSDLPRERQAMHTLLNSLDRYGKDFVGEAGAEHKLELLSSDMKYISNFINTTFEAPAKGRPQDKGRQNFINLLLMNFVDSIGRWPSGYKESKDYFFFREVVAIAGIHIADFERLYSTALAKNKNTHQKLFPRPNRCKK